MKCGICTQECSEPTHLSIYVSGSEGIYVCFSCRMVVTDFVRQLRGIAAVAKKQGYMNITYCFNGYLTAIDANSTNSGVVLSYTAGTCCLSRRPSVCPNALFIREFMGQSGSGSCFAFKTSVRVRFLKVHKKENKPSALNALPFGAGGRMVEERTIATRQDLYFSVSIVSHRRQRTGLVGGKIT